MNVLPWFFALASCGSGIVTIVNFIHKHAQGKPKGFIVTVFSIITVVLIGLSVFFSQVNAGTNSAITGSTRIHSIISTPLLSPTPTPTPTNTPTPTKVPIQLSCGQCNDPIIVTIKSITITSNEMIWNITLQNISGNSLPAYFSDFTLHYQNVTGASYQGTGSILTDYHDLYGSLCCGLDVGKTAEGTVIFTFSVLKGVPFILTAHIVDDSFQSTNFIDVTFFPTTFVF